MDRPDRVTTGAEHRGGVAATRGGGGFGIGTDRTVLPVGGSGVDDAASTGESGNEPAVR